MDGGSRRGEGFPPNFPRPFGGMGFGSSLFSDFFSRDPFDDPFFRQPFGSMFGGNAGFPHAGFLGQRPHNHGMESFPSGPVITELDDDATANTGRDVRGSNQAPVVEHPEDDDAPGERHARRRELSEQQGSRQSYGGAQVFSFSRSSVVQSGFGGQRTFSSTTTRRMGPGGVMEEQHVESDSTNGETVRHVRGIGDRGRVVTRKRNLHGEENVHETLHNIQNDECEAFNAAWEQEARGALPGGTAAPSLPFGGLRGQRALPESTSARGGSRAHFV